MHWKKLGRIFCPSNNFSWMVSHASYPLAEQLKDSIHRIYFSCRDADKRSSIGYVEVDLYKPANILNLSETPVIQPGKPGYFDDSGTTGGCIVYLDDGQRYFYYLGWNLAVTVPFRNSIGLAVSRNKQEPFEKLHQGRAPILDRSISDPLTVSYPWVLRENNRWRMWYGSHLSWSDGKHEMVHVLKYAESEDGIAWSPLAAAVIPFKSTDEYAISRPCILKFQGVYRMWYSYRGNSYRIGYAESQDGITWQRRDEDAGIDVSASGWDSESIEYSSVFVYDNQLFMLYNGSKYGETGFGLAVFEGEMT